MNRLLPDALDQELKRRLAILVAGDSTDRRLPPRDAIVLAAITIGSFVIVATAQAL